MKEQILTCFVIALLAPGASVRATVGRSVAIGFGTGAAVGGIGGAVLNYRNKGGNAAVGAVGMGIVGALLACIIHKEIVRRDELIRKETLFRLDTFGVVGVPRFKKEGKSGEGGSIISGE